MSKTKAALLSAVFIVGSHAASAATLDVLVAKQREAMEMEIDKKIQDASGASKAGQSASTSLSAPSPSVSADSAAKKAARSDIDDLRVNAIYGVNGATTVDVSIGDGPSYPLTKDRSIKGWSIVKVSPSSVTFRNTQTKTNKTIYLAEPTMSAALSGGQQPVSGFVPPIPGMPVGMSSMPRMPAQ